MNLLSIAGEPSGRLDSKGGAFPNGHGTSSITSLALIRVSLPGDPVETLVYRFGGKFPDIVARNTLGVPASESRMVRFIVSAWALWVVSMVESDYRTWVADISGCTRSLGSAKFAATVLPSRTALKTRRKPSSL